MARRRRVKFSVSVVAIYRCLRHFRAGFRRAAAVFPGTFVKPLDGLMPPFPASRNHPSERSLQNIRISDAKVRHFPPESSELFK